MIKWLIILTTIISLQLFYELKAQDDAISPQLWNNVYVGWNITDKIVVRTALSYNVLIASEVPWSELTYSASGVYRFHRFMEVNAGIIYQDANTTTVIPVNPIRNEITYFIVEWGIAYIIPQKKRD